MLKAKQIDHVNMSVKNLAESVRFYNRLFGFEVLKEQPHKNSMIIGNKTVKLCLYEEPVHYTKNRGAINHFGLNVENFDEILKVCKSMNVTVRYGGIRQWEKSRSLYIEDPNGYEIELTEKAGGDLG